VRDVTKVRFGWPLLALCCVVGGLLEALYEGAGWLTLALVPAAIVGFVLGRVTTTPRYIVEQMRYPRGGLGFKSATFVAVVTTLVLWAISTAGSAALLLPVALSVIGGYLISLATRRDVLEAVERFGGRDRW
jgi:hypothetical protein